MKRGTKFLIGFAAAILTFSTLVAFMGPPHTSRQGHWDHTCSGLHHNIKADSIHQSNKK